MFKGSIVAIVTPFSSKGKTIDEKKLREVKDDLKKLRLITQTMQLSDGVSEPEMMKMFDERYRIQFALKLTNNKRRPASKLLNMSERNLYRLMSEYHLI